jgi:hypothetical protein
MNDNVCKLLAHFYPVAGKPNFWLKFSRPPSWWQNPLAFESWRQGFFGCPSLAATEANKTNKKQRP